MDNITKRDKGRVVLLGGNLGTLFTINNAVEAARRTGVGLVVGAIEKELVGGLESISGKYKVQGFDIDYPEELITLINKSNSLGGGFGIEDDLEEKRIKKFYLNLLNSLGVISVIDADLIVFIANNKSKIDFKKQHILTYNIKETDLYFGEKLPGDEKIIKESQDLNCWLVLKGAMTRIVSPNGEIRRINTNSIPEMTMAGMGDVLTGIIAGLVAQGYTQRDAIEKGIKLREAAAKYYLNKTNSSFILPENIIESMPFIVKEVLYHSKF